MAGLVPAIYVLLACDPKDVDARDKRGHDADGPAAQSTLSSPSIDESDAVVAADHDC